MLMSLFNFERSERLYIALFLCSILLTACHNNTLVPSPTPTTHRNLDSKGKESDVKLTKISKEKEKEIQKLFKQKNIYPLVHYIDKYDEDESMTAYVQRAKAEREKRCTEVEQTFKKKPKNNSILSKLEKKYNYSCPNVVANFAREVAGREKNVPITSSKNERSNDLIALEPSEQDKIVTATALRVRSTPDINSKKLSRLTIGTIIKVSHRTKQKNTIDETTDYWYKIQIDGKDGWIFGGFIEKVNLNNLPKVYVKIAREKLDSKESDFWTFVSLWHFLNQVSQEVKDEAVATQLEEMREEALSGSLSAIPKGKETEDPYKIWLEEQKENIMALQRSATPALTTGNILEIPLKNIGGVYMLPVKINEAVTLDFILDTGASEVVIPADVFLTLVRTGTIGEKDLLKSSRASLADGSVVEQERVLLRELEVGGHKIDNVQCSITSIKGEPLLGQSFLRELGSYSLDNNRHVLILKH